MLLENLQNQKQWLQSQQFLREDRKRMIGEFIEIETRYNFEYNIKGLRYLNMWKEDVETNIKRNLEYTDTLQVLHSNLIRDFQIDLTGIRLDDLSDPD